MIKVMVPWAPSADQLLPYLRRLDENRWYTNNGPLVRELEHRMGGVSCSSATLGLELAARLVFRKKRVRIPAFTFVATATALLRAGYEPVLCDVGEDWALTHIDEQSLPVCPFGASVTPGPLVDAAAGWGNQTEGVRVFSLHATKALSGGEGGMICGLEYGQTEYIREQANFGLRSSTQYEHGVVCDAGTNAKMSEYHAAVALASLDSWPVNAARRMTLAKAYRDRLNGMVETHQHEGVMTTFPILVPDAERVAADMSSRGIQTRRWYTPTLDLHPAFTSLEREGKLENVRRLQGRILCLPFHLHMTLADVERVCEVLEWAMRKNRIFSPLITPKAGAYTANQLRI